MTLAPFSVMFCCFACVNELCRAVEWCDRFRNEKSLEPGGGSVALELSYDVN